MYPNMIYTDPFDTSRTVAIDSWYPTYEELDKYLIRS